MTHAIRGTGPAVPMLTKPAPPRLLLQLRCALDPGRQRAARDHASPRTLAHSPGPLPASNPTRRPRARATQRPTASWRLAMVIHYPPARLRRNSDRPTAITNVLVATSGSSHRTGDI